MTCCLVSFSGDLPSSVYSVLKDTCSLEVIAVGDVDPKLPISVRLSIGQIGHLLGFLRAHKINRIFIAGHVKRPKSFKEFKCDTKGLVWLYKLKPFLNAGDDTLLSKIVELFAKEGIEVCSVCDDPDLARGLLWEASTRTLCQPSIAQKFDIDKGVSIIHLLSHMDIGQAVVIQNGLVLGIETIEGTASLLSRIQCCNTYPDIGGVLVKMPKLGQSLKIDLPTIGLETVEQVYRAGLSGIAIDFKKCIVLNKDDVLRQLNKYNMFLVDVYAK